MPLSAGARLGSYEVASLLGAGGMGEVYRARDTRLRRDVALKILPDGVSGDPERLRRFEREAQTLAALNHPNIAQIYGVEETGSSRALVMELVPGETLDEIISRGPVPATRVMSLARQLVDALDAAHERGIVHRDLKPANIKVRPDGTLKVLDFGLAKALAVEAEAAETAIDGTLPTVAPSRVAGTQIGIIVGTPAYMSPEQATGSRVDKRTDIWAFGCVLWEMFTGRRLFGGETPAQTLGAVFSHPIAIDELPGSVRPRARRLIERCLDRDPRQRLRDIGDARAELADGADEEVIAGSASQTGSRLPWLLAVVMTVVATVALALYLRGRTTPLAAEPITATLPVPTKGTPWLTISPDGRMVTFAFSDPIGRPALYRRELAKRDAELVSTDAVAAFFSLDSNWIAFVSSAGNLLKIPSRGGSNPTVIADIRSAGIVRSGAWTEDGRIVVSGGKGLFVIPAGGTEPTALPTSDSAVDDAGPFVFDYDPTSRLLLFGTPSPPQMWTQRLSSSGLEGKPRRLVAAGQAQFATPGYLVYPETAPGASAPTRLLAAPFDASTLTLGAGVPILDDVPEGLWLGHAVYSFSRTGSLVYLQSAPGQGNRLVWVSRTGNVAFVPGLPVSTYSDPAVSPAGDFAYIVVEGTRQHLWIHKNAGGETRVTQGEASASSPAWRRGDLTYMTESGAKVWSSKNAESDLPRPPGDFGLGFGTSWSPDGRSLLLMLTQPNRGWDIGVVSGALSGSPRFEPVAATPALEARPVFSPDGRFIAYASDEKNNARTEIYVRAYPGPSTLWQVSTEGGDEPRWSRDGREIFYRDGRHMMTRRISGNGEPTGEPVALFVDDFVNRGWVTDYDVTFDGRFLMLKPEDKQAAVVVITTNWLNELKARLGK